MELVILSGPSKSSKTNIFDRLYNCLTGNEELPNKKELTDDQIFVKEQDQYASGKEDHRVLLRGKDKNGKYINVVITSQGDNTDELLMNVLFFINSSLYCKNKFMSVDYWLLSENTSNKKVPKYIEKLINAIKDYPLENKKTIKTKHYRTNLTNIDSDNDTHLSSILEILNI